MRLRLWCALTLEYTMGQYLKRPSQNDLEPLSGREMHGFRNRKENFEDDVIGVCAGPWNLVLSY